MDESFLIKLTGHTLPGRSRDSVAVGLSSLMRIDLERALGLLAGREVTVKHQLMGQAVPRYVQALERAGAEVRIERLSAPSPVTSHTLAEAPATLAALDFPGPTTSTPETVARFHPAANVTVEDPGIALERQTSTTAETMRCPSCGTWQAKRNLCVECGVEMTRLSAQGKQRRAAEESAFAPPRARLLDGSGHWTGTDTPRLLAFSLHGRIGRLRYLAYTIPAYLPLLIAAVIGGIVSALGGSPGAFLIPFAIGGVLTAALSLRVVILRLHDLNRSAWWLLMPVALGLAMGVAAGVSGRPSPGSVLGLTVLLGLCSLVLFFWPGSRESNDYGPPPGENTVWTIVGAIAMIALTIAGSVLSPAEKYRSAGKLPGVSANPAVKAP